MSNYITTDTELTSVANAIRTKGGTSLPLTYPNGFVSAIENIPSGGGGGDIVFNADRSTLTLSDNVITIPDYCAYYAPVTSVNIPSTTIAVGAYAFYHSRL